LTSVLLLSLLLPYTEYSKNESPFVTFFSSIGNPGVAAAAGSIMNCVVLTAALSSLNAGLYSTGRSLRSMSVNGAAPKFTGVMNKSGVPYGGILVTGFITLLRVGLNAIVPDDAFLIPLLIVGWFAARRGILEIAKEREGYTGSFPVIPERPGIDSRKDRDG
jgi:L-asparagine permease